MKHYKVIFTLLLSSLLVACTHEIEISEPGTEMTFTASINNEGSSAETKSATASTVMSFGDGMTLTIEESDIKDNFEEVVTKGTVVTTENFSDLICRAGRLHITAFNKNGESSVPYISDYFKYDGQYWRPLQSMFWPDYPMDIYALARPLKAIFPTFEGSPDTYYRDSEKYTQYGYCLLHEINPVNRTYCQSNGERLDVSEDLLYARTESDPNYSGSLNLTFKHILTAVKFVTGSKIPSGTVKDIRIGGIYHYNNYAVFHFDTEEWDFEDSSYCETIHVPGIDYSKYYDDDRDSFYEHYLNYKTTDGEAGLPITDEFQTLFIIPQKCDENAYIEIDFQYDGESDVMTYQIPLPDGFEFKMGKQITFSIGFASDFLFEFIDQGFSDVDMSFTPGTINIPLRSINRTAAEGADYSAPWKILSYQIGSNDPVEVNSEEVNTGDLLLKRNGNILQVTDKRVALNPSTHEYWTGANGDWSPAPYSGEPIDLSRFDAKTETENAFQMTTANTYIIRHAGTYKLPLVYGNAIENGIENVEAYFPAVNDPDGIHEYDRPHFLTHKGTPITSAFIENNMAYDDSHIGFYSSGYGSGLISEINIVGEDIGEITESNKYDKNNVRYLQFKVDQDNICQGHPNIHLYFDANSDGIFNSGDKEIWSWNIWITNNPSLLEPDIKMTPNAGADEEFFPIYCLGWIDDDTYMDSDDVTVTLLQESSSNTVSFKVYRSLTPLKTSNRTSRYAYGQRSPSTASISTIDNSWTGWNFNEYDPENYNFIKTIYDPSPIGYKLPKVLFSKSVIKMFTDSYGLSNKTIKISPTWGNTNGVLITDRNGRSLFFPCNHSLGDIESGEYLSSVYHNPMFAFDFTNQTFGQSTLKYYNDQVPWFINRGAVRPVKQ